MSSPSVLPRLCLTLGALALMAVEPAVLPVTAASRRAAASTASAPARRWEPTRHVVATAPAPAPAPRAARATPSIAFTFPQAAVAAAPGVATITIPGAMGAFSVPYIQTQPDLPFSLRREGAQATDLTQVLLDAGTDGEREVLLGSDQESGTFTGISYGEHTLTARLYRPTEGTPAQQSRAAAPIAEARLSSVARGDIVASLGDSTTEGLGGGPWSKPELDNLAFFPDWIAARAAGARAGANWVTADGRNYPQSVSQFPGHSRPSFTVGLGSRLEADRGRPVLVINEGWSGITSDGMVHVAESNLLQAEFGTARPDIWLLNLGANDAIVHRSPVDYQLKMQQILNALVSRYGAVPGDIHIACPSYAKQQARHQEEEGYLNVVNLLRANDGLGAGPDFYHYYLAHQDGIADQVHPNAAGYTAMGIMWAQSVAGASATC